MLIVILKAVWRTEIMVTCSVIKNKKVATYATKNVSVSTGHDLCFRRGIGKEKGNDSWQDSPEDLAELFALE